MGTSSTDEDKSRKLQSGRKQSKIKSRSVSASDSPPVADRGRSKASSSASVSSRSNSRHHSLSRSSSASKRSKSRSSPRSSRSTVSPSSRSNSPRSAASRRSRTKRIRKFLPASKSAGSPERRSPPSRGVRNEADRGRLADRRYIRRNSPPRESYKDRRGVDMRDEFRRYSRRSPVSIRIRHSRSRSMGRRSNSPYRQRHRRVESTQYSRSDYSNVNRNTGYDRRDGNSYKRLERNSTTNVPPMIHQIGGHTQPFGRRLLEKTILPVHRNMGPWGLGGMGPAARLLGLREGGGGASTSGRFDNTTATRKLKVDRGKICPFLLRVFYRTDGLRFDSMHNVFANTNNACNDSSNTTIDELFYPPLEPNAPELQIYGWMDLRLRELTNLCKDVCNETRKRNARLFFKLVYTDADGKYCMVPMGRVHSTRHSSEDNTTLHHCKFKIGDFILLSVVTSSERDASKCNLDTSSSCGSNDDTIFNDDSAAASNDVQIDKSPAKIINENDVDDDETAGVVVARGDDDADKSEKNDRLGTAEDQESSILPK